MRRSPDLKWRHSPETIEQINETQAKILNAACKLPKVGGVLVYATCSILQEENENMVKRFNAQHPEFEALDIEQALTTQGVQQASQLVKGQCLRLWPHLHHTDGFFCCYVETYTLRVLKFSAHVKDNIQLRISYKTKPACTSIHWFKQA